MKIEELDSGILDLMLWRLDRGKLEDTYERLLQKGISKEDLDQKIDEAKLNKAVVELTDEMWDQWERRNGGEEKPWAAPGWEARIANRIVLKVALTQVLLDARKKQIQSKGTPEIVGYTLIPKTR